MKSPGSFMYSILNLVALTIVDPWTCADGGYFRTNITNSDDVPGPRPLPHPHCLTPFQRCLWHPRYHIREFAVVAILAAVLDIPLSRGCAEHTVLSSLSFAHWISS